MRSLPKLFFFTCISGCALLPVAARAETIDISDNHGGSVAQYNARWTELAGRGVNVRIVGPCQSACTVLLGRIPRSRIFVTPEASFGFHLARRADATATLRRAYSADIAAWINAHGGLTQDFIWMRAPDTFRYFRKC
jgi:ABC-type Fe3+ transport system substrate-binding protein